MGRKLSSGSQAAGTRGNTIGELWGRYQAGVNTIGGLGWLLPGAAQYVPMWEWGAGPRGNTIGELGGRYQGIAK